MNKLILLLSLSMIGCAAPHKRVVAFGDSITFGRPFDGEHVWSYAYGVAEDQGAPLENMAVSGSRIDEDNQIGRIQRYEFRKGDTVILLTGTNSAMQFGDDPDQIEAFKASLTQAIETILKNDVVLVVGTTPNTGGTFEAAAVLYAQAVRDVVVGFGRSKVRLADVNDAMAYDPSLYVEDLVHPNLEGQHVMLNVFEGAL